MVSGAAVAVLAAAVVVVQAGGLGAVAQQKQPVEMKQTEIPVTIAGGDGTAKLSLLSGGDSVEPLEGDLLRIEPPTGTKLKDISCGTIKEIDPKGAWGTCLEPSYGTNWGTERLATVTVDPDTQPGDLTDGKATFVHNDGTPDTVTSWTVRVLGAKVKQDSVPTLAAGTATETTFTLQMENGGKVPPVEGDVLRFEPPTGTRIIDHSCGTIKESDPDGAWATCTVPGNGSDWNPKRRVTVAVDKDTKPGKLDDGKVTLSAKASNRAAQTAPKAENNWTVLVPGAQEPAPAPRTVELAQGGDAPTAGAGAPDPTEVPLTLKQPDGSAVPAETGDVLRYEAPDGITITDISCPDGMTKAVDPSGTWATCTNTSGTTWDTEPTVSVKVGPDVEPGEYEGTVSLKDQDGTLLDEGPWTIKVLAPEVTQEGAAPTLDPGLAKEVPVTLALEDGSAAPAAAGEVLRYEAPPGTEITDTTCDKDEEIAPDGSWATCTSPEAGTWSPDEGVTLRLAPNAQPGETKGKVTLSDDDGNVEAQGPLTVRILAAEPEVESEPEAEAAPEPEADADPAAEPEADAAEDPAATDGSTDGATDGTTDGSTDGSTDGTTDGSTDDSTDGPTGPAADSADEPAPDAAADATDGTTAGATGGSTAGSTSGSTSGSTDGATASTSEYSTAFSTSGSGTFSGQFSTGSGRTELSTEYSSELNGKPGEYSSLMSTTFSTEMATEGPGDKDKDKALAATGGESLALLGGLAAALIGIGIPLVISARGRRRS